MNPKPPPKPRRKTRPPRTSKVIVTPTVVAEARAQSGCGDMPGGFLENEGGQGSVNDHWESRLYQGDVMLPSKRVRRGGI
jgi:hypothetical protein